MKHLLDLLDDVRRLLAKVDTLEDVTPESREKLKEMLEGMTVQSVRLLKTADADPVGGREAMFQRALEAISHARLDEAEAILRSAVEKYPDDTELHNHLGLVAWEKGDLRAAADYYADAMGVGFPEEGAVDWFDDRNRPFLRAMEGHALSLYRSGHPDEALPLFESLADMNPAEYGGCRYLAGEIRHARGDVEDAVADYEMVPPEPAVLYNLALGLYELDRLEDAATAFIRAFVANRHIACLLLDRPLDAESQIPGYLASEAYAREFVEACRKLWDHAGARRFLERCFDHPLVQVHLEQCSVRLIDDVMSSGAAALREEAWAAEFGGTDTLGSLARRVLESVSD